MPETPASRQKELFVHRNMAQVHLIQLMILNGSARDAQDWIARFKPVFDMLAAGSLEAPDPDWDRCYREAQTLIRKHRDFILDTLAEEPPDYNLSIKKRHHDHHNFQPELASE